MTRHYLLVLAGGILAAAFGGCEGPAPPPTPMAERPSAEAAHAHDHTASDPHAGHRIELGDSPYQAELSHDATSGRVAVELRHADVKGPVAVDPPQVTLQLLVDGDFVSYTLTAADAAATEGGPTRFELVDPALCELLAGPDGLRGRLSVEIEGRRLVGDVEHAAHDDDHAHNDHGHDDDHAHDDGHDDDDHDDDGDHDHGAH